MSEDWSDKIARGGLNAAGKTVGKVGEVAVDVAVTAAIKSLQRPDLDVPSILLEIKPRFQDGAVIETVDCSICNSANEVGQVECYICGQRLSPPKNAQELSNWPAPWKVLITALIGFSVMGFLGYYLNYLAESAYIITESGGSWHKGNSFGMVLMLVGFIGLVVTLFLMIAKNGEQNRVHRY